jgi:hypothetical protein
MIATEQLCLITLKISVYTALGAGASVSFDQRLHLP